jgi:aryl-alcohol dehydrogenase-like predicted oxidoreductase
MTKYPSRILGGAMGKLVREGLARWIGVSNFERSHVERCLSIYPLTSVQNELSLLRQQNLTSGLLAWLADREIGYLAYGPLCFGLLTGTIDEASTFAEGDWRGAQRAGSWHEEGPFSPDAFSKNLEIMRRLGPFAERMRFPLERVALRWVLEQTGVTAVIAGSRSAQHVRSNAAAGDLSFNLGMLRELEDLVDS